MKPENKNGIVIDKFEQKNIEYKVHNIFMESQFIIGEKFENIKKDGIRQLILPVELITNKRHEHAIIIDNKTEEIKSENKYIIIDSILNDIQRINNSCRRR